MADDNVRNGSGENEDFTPLEGGDGDDTLGNLPPLSDFESSSTGEAPPDSGLPPLGDLDMDQGGSPSGLPPIDELQPEDPNPAGGNIKPPPPGFESASDGPSSGGFESPAFPADDGGSGFQDLAGDSSFAPASESDLETPMFDSAFGAGGDSDFGQATPQPTQAMETPMFGGDADGSGGGFEDGGGFGMGGDSDFETGGTPMPDFSPDTGMEGMAGAEMPVGAGMPMGEPEKRGPGLIVTIIVALVCAAIGIGVGPLLTTMLPFLPNPLRSDITNLQSEISTKDGTIADLRKQVQDLKGGESMTPEQLAELKREFENTSKQLQGKEAQLEEVQGKLQQGRTDLAMILDDIEAKNLEYIEAQDKYEELVNEMSIVQARHLGLLAEVDRLTNQVGQLEDANARRLASKEALEHDIERLTVMVKESLPLTPQQYSRKARLDAIEELRLEAAAAKWVTPALLEKYTALYQQEVEIASEKVYFFANIPVKDEFGTTEMKWAECLMIGTWAVYYRSIDGENIGIYENVADAGPPQYAFREEFSKRAKEVLQEAIFDARIEGYEAKLAALDDKQEIREGMSTWQEIYDSL